MNSFEGPLKWLMSILLFPVFFQESLLAMAWTPGLYPWETILKRSLLLLPVSGIIFSCWVTIPCMMTVIVRSKRREFLSLVFITWWDLGRAIFSYWGGILKFLFTFIGWMFLLLRLAVFALWMAIQDILLSPIRVAKDMGQVYFQPGTPWIAVVLTIVWCLFEAGVFTYVLMPMVSDMFQFPPIVLEVGLFGLMFALLLGSFAVLSTWVESVKTRDIRQILMIGVFEFTVMGFEVLFLYREFVDMLIPWVVQMTGGEYRPGIISILAVSSFAWVAIRGMVWFLFAEAGTPTIMAIIKRTGLQDAVASGKAHKIEFTYIKAMIDRMKSESQWLHEKGDEMLSAFIMPPLQIIAACTNFLSVLITGDHMFALPFKSAADILKAKELIIRYSTTHRRAEDR
jgi:hypothetical protein